MKADLPEKGAPPRSDSAFRSGKDGRASVLAPCAVPAPAQPPSGAGVSPDSVIERYAAIHDLTCGQARWCLFLQGFPPNQRLIARLLGGWSGAFRRDWALTDKVAGARSQQQLRRMLLPDHRAAHGGLMKLLNLRISRRRLHTFARGLLLADPTS